MGLIELLMGKKKVAEKAINEQKKMIAADISRLDRIPQTEAISGYSIEKILSGFEKYKNLEFAVKGNIYSQKVDYKNISLKNVWSLYQENFYESQCYSEGFYFIDKQENSVKHYLKVLQGRKIGELKLDNFCGHEKSYIDLCYRGLLEEPKHKRIFLNLEDFSYDIQKKLCFGCSFGDLEIRSGSYKELIIFCEILNSDK